MVIFATLYGLAVVYRYQAMIHKRLKTVASIAMLSPALVRILRMLDLNDFVTLPIWLLFMAALPVYDYRRLKKVHPATWRSTAFLLILIFGGSAFAMSDAWVKLAAALFG